MLPVHPAYTDSVTAAIRDTVDGTSFDGDPFKFAEAVYRLVAAAEDGKKLPLFLPMGEDSLEKFENKWKEMGEVLVDVSPWSADLKKDYDPKAKL